MALGFHLLVYGVVAFAFKEEREGERWCKLLPLDKFNK